MKAFIAKRVSDAIAVDDIVQDVFVSVARHIDSLEEEEKLHAWMYRIARNAIVDHYRKRRTLEQLPLDLQAPAEKDDHDTSKELGACLRPMIEALPGKYKEAIILSELNGMTQKQLSETLGLSYSGAKSRV